MKIALAALILGNMLILNSVFAGENDTYYGGPYTSPSPTAVGLITISSNLTTGNLTLTVNSSGGIINASGGIISANASTNGTIYDLNSSQAVNASPAAWAERIGGSYIAQVQRVPGSEGKTYPLPSGESRFASPAPKDTTGETIPVYATSDNVLEAQVNGKVARITSIADKTIVEAGGVSAESWEILQFRQDGLNIITASGNKKIALPDEALSAVTRIEEASAKIELKVIEGDAVYEITGGEKGRLFGVLEVNVPVKASVNAEKSIVEKVEKPWWSFLVWG